MVWIVSSFSTFMKEQCSRFKGFLLPPHSLGQHIAMVEERV